jgi:hypothetical protein
MDLPKTPLWNRLVVAVFLVAWGSGQAITVWGNVQGNFPAWTLFVTSAPSPEDYPMVDTDARFDSDWRWNPTWVRGDELLRVNDVDLRGASSTAFTRVLMDTLRADGNAEVEWMRDGKRSLEIYHAWPNVFWPVGLPLSIASAIAAVMLLLRAPHWQLSRLGFVFFACVSIFALRPGLAPMFIGPGEALQLVVRPLLGAVAILIAARFPDSPPPVKRWDLALAAVTFVATAGLYLVLGFGPFRGFVYGAALLLVAFGTTMSVLLAGNYRRLAPLGQRQIRWFVYGAYVSLGGLVFGNLAFVIDPPLLFMMGLPMSLAFAVLPIGFLIAVFGYRFLDADPLISSATSYFFLGVAVLVAIEMVIPQVAELAGALGGVATETTELALAITVAFLAIPVHRFVRPRIERVFFPERPALEDGIHELLDEVSDIEDQDRMIEHLCSRLADFLNTRTCIFFGRDQSGYEARYSVGAEPPPTIATESPLVIALRERSTPLAADRLSRRDRIQQLPSAERAILTGLDVSVVVPIRERGHLPGFICLGAKRSGDIYTSTDLALLTAVANVVSVRNLESRG